MLKSHERFHSANGKRLVLIVDDEFINRELLRSILQADYELIFAENGKDALDLMRENKNVLSLVLLDLIMPVMSGTEALKAAKADSELSQIPIIVLTSDQEAEIECLTLGAADFISKPYPQPGVVQARILRTIELSEDRQIISSTERDTVTGLYNRDYFYRYAEQFDKHHEDIPMDAIVVDVNHFHMINERFGTAHGDKVLKNISTALREEVVDKGGIVCRRESDIFLVYCPHGLDYGTVLANTTAKASGEGSGDALVWLRMGVYENIDKGMDVIRRFDRAKMAADTVRGSFATQIGFYDSDLHEKELFQEQLIEDFDAAIRERQFQVYFQPKFDVRPDIPVLASAEALVRWMHPKQGMISPGVFIPLFEQNGLIQSLDTYVWRETAAHIREWRNRFDFAVPVSVNVSRIDMYDPHLVETLLGILSENDLTTHDLLLEITESAYTQDSDQIITTVNKLRRLGFKVEMDDFGTGYSSLNMISTLPIDALKMDMQFIRSAFSENGDTKMLEVIIDIAEYLSIPVIAEGVETQEQMIALREMGCELVQGYYFSRPVPADEYEKFVVERKRHDERAGADYPAVLDSLADSGKHPFEGITHALSSGFEQIYYVDTESGHYVEFSSHGNQDDLQIENSGSNFFDGTLRRLLDSVCAEDSMRVELSLRKQALLAQTAGATPFFITYRVMNAGVPVYYSLEAARAQTHDGHHIVVGLRNVDDQIKEADADQHIHELNFSSFAQALSGDVETMYYVDVDTGLYAKFEVSGVLRELKLVEDGVGFFDKGVDSICMEASPDVRDDLRAVLSKEAIIDALSKRPSVSKMYHMNSADGEDGGDCDTAWYRLKAVWADSASRRRVVVGISCMGE